MAKAAEGNGKGKVAVGGCATLGGGGRLTPAQAKAQDQGGVRAWSQPDAAARGARAAMRTTIVALANLESATSRASEAALAKADKSKPVNDAAAARQWAQYVLIPPARCTRILLRMGLCAWRPALSRKVPLPFDRMHP